MHIIQQIEAVYEDYASTNPTEPWNIPRKSKWNTELGNLAAELTVADAEQLLDLFNNIRANNPTTIQHLENMGYVPTPELRNSRFCADLNNLLNNNHNTIYLKGNSVKLVSLKGVFRTHTWQLANIFLEVLGIKPPEPEWGKKNKVA